MCSVFYDNFEPAAALTDSKVRQDALSSFCYTCKCRVNLGLLFFKPERRIALLTYNVHPQTF